MSDKLDIELFDAIKSGDLEKVKELVAQDADITALDYYALKWAAQYGHLQIVKYLVSIGTASKGCRAQEDAFQCAVANGYIEIVKFLAPLEADFTYEYNYALDVAAANGHINIVKYFVEEGADFISDDNYAFRSAVFYGQLEVVKYLLSVCEDNRIEMLHAVLGLAAAYNQLEMVKYVVSQGADITDDDNYALKMAAVNGHLEIVKYLVEKGADVTVCDNYALRQAKEEGHIEVVEYLKLIIGKCINE